MKYFARTKMYHLEAEGSLTDPKRSTLGTIHYHLNNQILFESQNAIDINDRIEFPSLTALDEGKVIH